MSETSILDIVILALATWRMSSLLANENGPGDSIERFRLCLGVEYNEESERVATTGIASEVLCQWCNSLWIGLAWTLFYRLSPEAAFFCALPFALSTGAILIMTSKGIQVFLRGLRSK